MRAAAQRLVARLDELGQVSDDRGALTRTFLSPAMTRANRKVWTWMENAGLQVKVDSTGNLIGSQEAKGRKVLVLGSHLDTVRNAGKFDGALGVLIGIAAIEVMRELKPELPVALEVVGFSEEEGVRFASAYLGSKGYVGALTGNDVAKADADGVTVKAALEAWSGRSWVAPKPAHRKADLAGYVETHIEQGPVLEAADSAVGVVSAIAGQTRGKLTFVGKAGHAGTTPMALRKDALAGAAEWISFVEAYATKRAPLVGTVGTIGVTPGAPNVIPAKAMLSLDLRHPRDAARVGALRVLVAKARQIAKRRGLTVRWEVTQDNAAVECDAALTRGLAGSIKTATGKRAISVVSGAGHDAVVVSQQCPVAMLFVRCREGLSHHPDEHAAPADLRQALAVLTGFLVGGMGR